MDNVSWGILTLSLTVVGGLYTWLAFRRWGAASGLKGAAVTLLPAAAYLTKTLEMFTRIVDAVTDWAAGLVFSPQIWVGTSLAGLSVVLYVIARTMSGLNSGKATPKHTKDTKKDPGVTAGQSERRSLPKSSGKGEPAIDDDLSDVEAILRKRGIS